MRWRPSRRRRRGALIWHGDRQLAAVDAVVLPGGFAHGDYLRPGALARFSPVMEAVGGFAGAGGRWWASATGSRYSPRPACCPGALQKNGRLRFLCEPARLRVASTDSVLTAGRRWRRARRSPSTISRATTRATSRRCAAADEDRIVLRYVDNPNGSVDAIAGICNEAGNVVGLMPHPERACSVLLGSADGLVLLGSLFVAAGGRRAGLSPRTSALVRVSRGRG